MVEKNYIKLCKENKEVGHKALYESSIRYVHTIVARYVRIEHVHKDIVQEIYANVFSNIKQYDSDKGTFKTWIRTIAVNQSLMYLRKKKQFSTLVPLSVIEPLDNSIKIDLSKFERKNVEIILSAMPIGYKTIFMLNVIDGYTHSDISDLLDISKETSRSQLSRAKRWLKTRLINPNKIQVYGSL